MRQVLFHIPGLGLPIYGYGFMLMLAFLVGLWLANRRARAEGIDPNHIWDVSFPIFLGGIVGARLLSRIMEPEPGGVWVQIASFFEIWRGGLILYGGVAGGLAGYLYAYYRVVRPNKLSTLRLADIIAPSLALGLLFGRLGCFLNGCCWGDVADPTYAPWAAQLPWITQFPANSWPHRRTVEQGYQTAFGFVLAGDKGDPRTVGEVEPYSFAWEAGLKKGNVIAKVGDVETPFLDVFEFEAAERSVRYRLANWPNGEPLRLTVRRGDQSHDLEFLPPRSLPLIPTQVYSALDGVVLFVLLTAFYPFRRRAGEVIVLLMLAYAVNRFFIEQMRMDNPPEWFGLTLSQNISILMFVSGLGMWWHVRKQAVPVPAAGAQG